MNKRLIAVSTFILPLAILFDRSLFRDEMLYVYLSRLLRQNPSLVYPYVPIYVPHPPGMLYRLALFDSHRRLAIFILSLLSFIPLYSLDRRAYLAIGSALPAVYSSIVFDDAPGAFLASAAALASYKRKYSYAALLFFLAALIRFQSFLIASAYVILLGVERKDIRTIILPLAGLPVVISFFLLYPNPLPSLSKPSYLYSFTMYAALLFLPHTLLLIIPLAYKDREARRMILSAYIVNALTRNVFDRYYLTAIDFSALRISEAPKRYKYLAIGSLFFYALDRRREIGIAIIGAAMIALARNSEETYLIANRFIAFFLALHLYLYALPHPCMRYYREKITGSRGCA